MRAGQIPGDVIPAGAAATPARAVAGGNGWDPGPPAGRAAIPDAGAQTRRMPAGPGRPADGSPPGAGTSRLGQPRGPRGGAVRRPAGTRAAATQPRGLRDGAARDPGRTARFPRAEEFSGRGPGRLGRWGALQGGLGVCIIVASAAIGAIVTMVTRSAPGFLLGLFVVVGTVAAALAVRPRAGRMIFPVPVLCYLVAALISGIIFDRSADSSKTALAIDAAQWIANGFFAMVLATALAVVIIVTRWLLWRRGRPATRAPGWPVPATGPAGTGPAGPGRRRPGRPSWTGTRWHTAAAAGGLGDRSGIRAPRASRVRAPAGDRAGRRAWGFWGPERPGVLGALVGDPGSRGTGPRPAPRPGSEPYNFSSGA